MTCRKCNHDKVKKFGCRNGVQRYRCNSCSAVFTDEQPRIGSHYTRQDEAEKALFMMLEGMSVRAISRITGLHKDTILSLMVTASENALRVFDSLVRNVRPKFVQLDELWCMVGCHGKNVTVDSPSGWGDAWTWLALDSDSKMILSFYIGPRNTVSAYKFIKDLSERTLGTYQITSDALRGYVGAIEEWYGADVHFAQLQKIYGRTEAGPEWYGGGRVIAAVPKVRTGNPDFSRISTSHIERANLSVRMHIRRYARKTNAISKKLFNLKAAVALFVVWYNFCRVHQTLRVTPAMEAGITDHVWGLAELLGAGIRLPPSFRLCNILSSNKRGVDHMNEVACRNVGCGKTIPLPDPSLLGILPTRVTINPDIGSENLACPECGHVFYYTPDKRYQGHGNNQHQDTDAKLHVATVGFDCAEEIGKAQVRIHVTISAGDANEECVLDKSDTWRIREAYCEKGQRDGHRVLSLPPRHMRTVAFRVVY